MRYLKQSTAVEVKVGPFLDETDGKTAETALTISQADVRLAKNEGDWAQKNESTTMAHEEAGWYRCLLDATDTNTVGILMLAVHESGALPVWMEFHVLVANVYDSLFGAGTDKLDVNVEEWNTTAVPAEHTAGYPVITIKDGTGTGEINTNGGKVVGVELVDVLTTYTNNTPQTGDSYARLGAPAGASVSADVASVKSDLTTLLSRITSSLFNGITSVAQWLGLIAGKQTGNSTALTEIRATGAGSGTYDPTTDSNEAVRDRGDAAWTTATGFSTHSAADVWAVATRVLTAGTNIQLPANALDLILIESSITGSASLTNDSGTQLTSINCRQAISLLTSAASAGVLAGAATTTITIKPAGKPSGNTRISATVDSDGNRSALTLKVPD